MISEGIMYGMMSPLTRHNVLGWVDQAMQEMKEKMGIVCNPWSKKGYKKCG